MKTIPLKQYFDSKKQLLDAVHNTPTALIEYEIKKYCTISIGESADESTIIQLKPKQHIIVEWVYYNVTTPTPTNLTISTIDSTSYELFWPNEKLNNWLTRYAKPGINSGHKV